jgi:transposase
MNDVTTYGLDLAKRVFQVHWVDVQSGEVCRKTLSRAQVSAFFARAARGVVAMEACGSAHHWARLLQTSTSGEVDRGTVRPTVREDQQDRCGRCTGDLGGGATAGDALRGGEERSTAGGAVLHRLRAQWVKVRTMQANQIRALLYEFGVVVPLGWRALLKSVPERLTATGEPVPTLLRGELLEQLEALRTATERIDALEKQLASWQRAECECQRITAIPGVGPLIATATIASVADARQFRSGREFAAYLGLVPGQSGTGGRVKLLGISKRGDSYLRMLLIHGARSLLLSHSRQQRDRPLDRWLTELLKRRPRNVVVVALANKMTRTIWALLAQGRTFDAEWGRAVTSN